MNHPTFGSGELRKLFEGFSPFLGYLYGVILLLFGVNFEPGVLTGANQLLEILGMNCGQDGEEVLPIASSSFWIVIREVLSHSWQSHGVVIEIGD